MTADGGDSALRCPWTPQRGVPAFASPVCQKIPKKKWNKN